MKPKRSTSDNGLDSSGQGSSFWWVGLTLALLTSSGLVGCDLAFNPDLPSGTGLEGGGGGDLDLDGGDGDFSPGPGTGDPDGGPGAGGASCTEGSGAGGFGGSCPVDDD